MNKRFFLWYVFCVLCSTSSILSMENEPENEAPSIILSNEQVLFEDQAVTEKSLLFKTQQDDGSDAECIIYTPSKGSIALTIIKNLQSTYISCKANSLITSIVRHATIAHKYGSIYTFYVTIKIPSKYFYEKDIYSVQKIDFDSTTSALTPTELFTHTSPIVHMGIIQQDNRKYLVVGSLYPSIKIYNLTDNTPVNPLHNRFLLGCINNTIMYAKKNDRPKTGLTRWLESRKKDQPFNCMLYSLTAPFNKDAEEPLKDNDNNNVLLTIHPQDYPLISEQHNSALTFVNNDCFCYLISKNASSLSLAKTQLLLSKDDWLKQKKLEKLLHTHANMIAQSIKERITLESFKQFAYENMDNQFMLETITTKSYGDAEDTYIYNNAFTAFIQWTIKNFFAKETLVDDSLVIHITGEIASSFIYNNRTRVTSESRMEAPSWLEEHNKGRIPINSQTIYQEDTYKGLQTKFSDQLFTNLSNIRSGTNNQYFLSANKYPAAQLFKNIIQANQNYTILYTDKKILVLHNRTKEKIVYDISVNYPDIPINQVIFIHNNMYLLSDKQLYAIHISNNRKQLSLSEVIIQDFIKKVNEEKGNIKSKEKARTEKHIPTISTTVVSPVKESPLPSEFSESIVKSTRSDQEKYNLVDQIIKEIKLDSFIASIKNDITQTNTFQINDQNVIDLPTISTRLDGAATILFSKYYLWPIIEKRLTPLLENMHIFTNKEILNITNKLLPLFGSYNIWLKGVEVQTIYGALKDKVIHEWDQLTGEMKANLKDRFGDIYETYSLSEKDQKPENHQNLAIIKYLSYCLGLEQEQIPLLQTREKQGFFGKTPKTIFKNKTYMEYIKELLLKNAENIKTEFNIDEFQKEALKKLL